MSLSPPYIYTSVGNTNYDKYTTDNIYCTPGNADGDPHFAVDVKGSVIPLCFTFDGESGQSLRLFQDMSPGKSCDIKVT